MASLTQALRSAYVFPDVGDAVAKMLGITPDVKVPEKDALPTAQRLALQHLIDKTTDQQALRALKQALAALDANR